jgi:hypothetical protein
MSGTSVIRRLGAGFLLLVSAVAYLGCATYRKPSVVVVDASPGTATDEAMTFDIHLDVANPNMASLRLMDFRYEIAIDGQPVFRGRRAAEATLASLDQRQLTIPAAVPFEAVGWNRNAPPHSARYSVTGSLQYIKPGQLAQILRDMGWPSPRASFTGSGEVRTRD